MQSDPTSEPTGSRVPGVSPRPTRPHHAPKGVRARLLSALRGDKHMVGAYPPEWPGDASAPDTDRTKER